MEKIIVIVGPTASGKTLLSIQLAQKYNGEIVSADSRQVYRGLDIGTGKVTQEEMLCIPHHLIDVVSPHDTYTVADFVRDGRNTISDILSRGKLPIIVGGTFLYVDTLLGKVSTPEVPPDETLRASLEKLNTEELFLILSKKDPTRAGTIDKSNKRRLIRALEIVDTLGSVPTTTPEKLYEALTLGISISKEDLLENISQRLSKRLSQGMVEEVQNLYKSGLSFDRLKELGIEYHYIAEFLQEKITYEEMREQIVTKSMQYSKRQMTWLKRDKEISWISPRNNDETVHLVTTFLKN